MLADDLSLFDSTNDEYVLTQSNCISDIDSQLEVIANHEVTDTIRTLESPAFDEKLKQSKFNYKMLNYAKDIFLKYLRMPDIPGDDKFVEIIPVTINLTEKCWKIFVRFVSSHNCIAMRRRATEEEKKLCKGKRERYVISVRKNKTTSYSSYSAEDLSSIASFSSNQLANHSQTKYTGNYNSQRVNNNASSSLLDMEKDNVPVYYSENTTLSTRSMQLNESSDGTRVESFYQHNVPNMQSRDNLAKHQINSIYSENRSTNINGFQNIDQSRAAFQQCSDAKINLRVNDSYFGTINKKPSMTSIANHNVDNNKSQVIDKVIYYPDCPVQTYAQPYSQVSYVPVDTESNSEIYYKRKFDDLVDILSKVIEVDKLRSGNSNSEASTIPIIAPPPSDSISIGGMKLNQMDLQCNDNIRSAEIVYRDQVDAVNSSIPGIVENSGYLRSNEIREATRENLCFHSDMLKRQMTSTLPSNQLPLYNFVYNLQNETNQVLVPLVIYNYPKISPLQTNENVSNILLLPSNDTNNYLLTSTGTLISENSSILNRISNISLNTVQQPSQHRSNLFQQVIVPTSALNYGIQSYL